MKFPVRPLAFVLLQFGFAAGAAQAANAEFGKFVDDYFAATFRDSPNFATYNGIHDYDDRIDDLSRAAIERGIAEKKQFLERLAKIDRKSLDFDEQIDAEAIEATIRAGLLDDETLREWERNPMNYVEVPGSALDGLMKRDFAPAPERLRLVVSRLKQVPGVYAALRANVKNPPKEFTDLSIRMAGGSIGFFEHELAQWAEQAAGTDKALLAQFTAANAEAVKSARELTAWLKDTLLPASKGNYAIGAQNFLLKLKYEEMVDLPLPELLAIGERQLAKDHADFIATAKQIDPSKSAAGVMRLVSDDHPTPEDLIPSVKRTVEQARQYLIDHQIVTVPSDVRPLIEETPPYARSGSFASMDTPGPFEKKATEAFYYVTPVEKNWTDKHKDQHLRLYNPSVVAMINVHEAFPGHYLQFLYAPRFPTKTRQILASGTNAEGWAHYAEQMMWEQGFGNNDPKIHLAQLQEALLRDCRYVTGIKLHTEGWTVEDAAKKLFQDMGFQEPANAYEEARRGAYNPTYLYYTLGKIEIQKLRDEYMKQKGKTLREFHDAFVAQGALPIPLVRKILLKP